MKTLNKKRHTEPFVIPRKKHPLSRRLITNNGMRVLIRLHKAGFDSYLVGGCVRDLLVGLRPKDFDVVTNATPEEVRRLFRNSRIIGRRFKLAHVYFGDNIIEVATFRTHHQDASTHFGRISDKRASKNKIYGTIEDDAWRRDFTINALYYNIADFSIIDYTNGLQDLKKKCLRVIGDPVQRYHEDPVRMLRAIRLAAKLDFTIESASKAPIKELGHLLSHVAPARLFAEVLKFFKEGASLKTVLLLRENNLFSHIFAETEAAWHKSNKVKKLLEITLSNTDKRLAKKQYISASFLLAAFLWYPIDIKFAELRAEYVMSNSLLLQRAISEVMKAQLKQLALPRHLQSAIRDICSLQLRFQNTRRRVAYSCFRSPRFRAAYDLLLYREAAGEQIGNLVSWWTKFIAKQQES